MLKANEDLLRFIKECPECHYSSEHEDWRYKDFTGKEVAICPQCGHEINLVESYKQVV